MAKVSLLAGTTSYTANLFIQDSTSTTGAGKTGLAYNTASLTAYYCLPKAASAAITLATQTTTGAYSSGGFVEVDATNMPGVYRFDVPNACLAASNKSCIILLKGATGMAPLALEFELTAIDNQTAATGGITNLDATISSRGTSTLTQTQVTGGAYSVQSASCVLGDARIANLDATVSSRGTSTLTQTQVTGGAYNIQSASCVLGDARMANLDTAVSTRGTSTLTQTQVTGGAYTIQSASCVLGDARIANLDATVSSRLSTAGYTAPPSAATIAGATWDVTLASHVTAGSTGYALNAAGAAGDPWSTAIPGAYGAGSAGYIVGNNLNAAVGSVPTATQNADALLNRDMSAVSDTNARSPLNALRFIRNKWVSSAGTLTVYKEDDTTSAWTATVGTTVGADPITSNDPA